MPDEKGRTSMGAKTEALAKQFEGKARDAVATLQKLGDADWKKVTAAEKWTVGVTAHHLAGALEAVAGIVTGIVSGRRHPATSPGPRSSARRCRSLIPGSALVRQRRSRR